MTLVVGCSPQAPGQAVLHLAGLLARSSGEDLVVTVVVPQPWAPGMARIDAEYREFLERRADRALEEARADLPADVPAVFFRHEARSAPAGLMEVADRYDANAVILGSSSAGMLGHVALGSVSDHLLHSSPRVVALAPRGFRCGAGARVTRVSAAYGGTDPTEDLVLGAAGLAALLGASLRLTSFAVRPRASVSSGAGTGVEELVVREWGRTIAEQARETIATVVGLPQPPPVEPSVVGEGGTWAAALDDVAWVDGDVLVVGSSTHGPLAQVFLGSRASKIVRHSPVPVVVVPRSSQTRLAEQARLDEPARG